MKKIISICVGFILFLWITMYLASCTPVRYVYVDPKDSIVRQQRIVRDYQYIQTPIYMDWYYRPYYSPTIVVPLNPAIHFNQTPRYIPRGGRH